MKWCYYHDRLIGIIKEVTPNPTLGAEIGVYRGIGSRALLATFPSLILVAVDPWEVGENGVALTNDTEDLKAAKAAFYRRIRHCQDRARVIELPSVQAAEWVEDQALDFVFIDGNHSRDSVMRDIEAWYPKLRSGGLLSGHDYNPQPSPHEVKPAVDEWVARTGQTLHLPGRTLWWCQKT